jgi:type II secretory pathway pseudopilin PulG
MSDKPRIHQAIENAMAIVGAIALGAVAAWFGINDYFRPKWETDAQIRANEAFQRQAVRDRAGAWDATADGAPRFRWTYCNQFGIKE